MAMAVSNFLQCPNYHFSPRKHLASRDLSPSPFIRFSRTVPRKSMVVCMAASAAGSSNPDSVNPYEVLGVSSIEGFDMIKAAYTRKRKEAERSWRRHMIKS